MEFFRDTTIRFMRYRRVWVVISIIVLLSGWTLEFFRGGLNLGIDFAGGTQMTLKFQQAPQLDRLRNVLGDAGVNEAQLQRFGAADSHEVLVKTPTAKAGEENSQEQVTAALNAAFNPGQNGFDLNQKGTESLTDLLTRFDPDGVKGPNPEIARAHYEGVATVVAQAKKDLGLIDSWDQLSGRAGISTNVLDTLRNNAHLGSFAILGVQSVGPQIGSELRKKGILAVLFSLLGMLIYIWLRFELRFGIGALVALTHDVLITLALFALTRYEFNLTTVAGFLTLVGYSVNDTVVVFDRVRENMRRNRRQPLEETMDESINQTLSRTVLTSGTTLLAVGSLLVLGGDVLRGFAFILTVGIVIGTYSSIYIASPFALWWENAFGRGARTKRKEAKAKA
jgi:preprotein translocase subunit SecF